MTNPRSSSGSDRPRFAPSLAATLATLALLPVLCALGFWQLDRAEQKQRILDTLENRASRPAEPWSGMRALDPEADEFRHVEVTGRYIAEYNVLLDNRIRQGRPGYHIYTPFQTDGGAWLLVNRGWVAAGPDRGKLPSIETAVGPITLRGQLRQPPGTGLILMEDDWSRWPARVQALDIGAMSRAAGRTLQPLVLLLGDDYADGVAADWPAVNMPPARHRGYAVQWFGIAAALVTIYVYWGVKGDAARVRASGRRDL